MTRDILNTLLDYVYELEGLTLLALNDKQDNGRLRELIVQKAGCIIEVCGDLDANDGEQIKEEAPSPNSFYELDNGDMPVTETVRVPADMPIDPAVATSSSAVVNPVPAPAVTPRVAPVAVTPKQAPAVPQKPVLRQPQPPTGAPAPEKARVMLSSAENAPRERRSLGKMFPINEWFLFRRELFANSDNDFKDSIAIVEDGGSLSLAEAYFYNDLQWNPDDPNVQAFMEIIHNYFRQ